MLRAFSNKKSLKFLVKSFLQWVFSLINWNTKPWTKQLLERPQQILANYVPISWRALSLLSFSDLLGKVNKRGPSPFLHSDTNPVLGHILVHSVSKSHFLVVTLESIWFLFFNILCINFVSTPNKSLRFTRLRRNYVFWTKLPCFFAWCVLFKVAKYLFCSCLSAMIVHLRNLFLLSPPVARMMLALRSVASTCFSLFAVW